MRNIGSFRETASLSMSDDPLAAFFSDGGSKLVGLSATQVRMWNFGRRDSARPR